MNALAALPAIAGGLYNVEAEAALIGALLIDNKIAELIAERITAEDFFEQIHSRIFDAISRHLACGEVVTPLTLWPEFENDAALKELDGFPYLARLTADGQGLLAPRQLADQIAELAERRRHLEWLEARKSACFDLSSPIDEMEPPRLQRTQTLRPLDLAALAKTEPRAKKFIIPRIAPEGEVTLFTGAGAIGKSLLAQQFATAIAAGVDTLGLSLNQAPAIYLTCEDDSDELHWRQKHICKVVDRPMASLAGELYIFSLRGEPDNALATFSPDGRLIVAPLYRKVASLIRSAGAKLVCLDNVSHLFIGNENDRGEVTRFINLLNRLAGETGAAIILMGHPNKAGDSYSGSTGWLNAVRSQVYMASPIEDDADPDVRTLTIGKPNYTRAGEALRLRWRDWAYVLEEDGDFGWRDSDAENRARMDEGIFFACLAERTRQLRAVSEKRSSTFAPTVFATMKASHKIGAKRLEAAMDRLYETGRIEREFLWKGPDRKPVYGLREVAGDGAGDGAGDTVRATRETLL